MYDFSQVVENIRRIGRYPSDKEVATALGVHRDDLSKRKRIGGPSFKAIHEWAQAEGISLDLVFEGAWVPETGEPPPVYETAVVVREPKEKELLDLWNLIDEGRRDSVLDILRGLAGKEPVRETSPPINSYRAEGE